MAVLCHSASSSLHSMMNETMLLDGPLMKDESFYLDSSHWSNGGGGGGGGGGRHREDPIRSYTMLTRHSVQQFCNTAVFSSTQFHAAQMTLNNSKISELDADDVSLDSWQKTHPEQWTCEDVLNLIYFIALKSNNIEFASLHGEKFQNVAGAELCSMTEQDFVLRDSKYGKMLYQCVRTLLEKSQFLPPEDVVCVKIEKPDCLKSIQTEIPRPVEELSFDESNDLFDDDKQNVISMFGINYDIDSAADFDNIQSTTDVVIVPSSSLSSSSSSLSSGVCADTTGMDVDQKPEVDHSSYDDNYAYHLNLYPNYHNAHHHHHHQQQQQQQQRLHHERSLVPDSTVVGGGGTPFPIDLRRNQETDSGAAGDLLWPQSERKIKRRRDKSISSDGEGSSGSNQNYHDVNRQSNNVGKNHLWEFLCQLLRMSESVQNKDRVIQWESREEGVFRIIDSKEVASLWGKHKGNEKMTYEKLSRALRWCRTFGFLAALPKDGKFPKKLCFRFGPRATNWRHFV